MKTRKLASLLSILGFSSSLLLTSCGSTLPNYSNLGDLRMLAMISDIPEAFPGSKIKVTPYLSDIFGNGRPLKFKAETCFDPGVNYGKEPTCEGSDSRTEIAEGTIEGLQFPNYTGPVNSFTITIPRFILAFASPDMAYNGLPYLLTYWIRDSENKVLLKAIKRIPVTSRKERNRHPVITSVEAQGVLFDPRFWPVNPIEMRVRYSDDSEQDYIEKTGDQNDETQRETITTTWFVSDGYMRRDRTQAQDLNVFNPPAEKPKGRNAILAIVARDGRGGEAIKIFQFDQ